MPQLSIDAKIGADGSKFSQVLRNLQGEVSQFKRFLGTINTGLGTLLGAIGIGSAGAALHSIVEEAGNLQDISDRFGISAGVFEQLFEQAKKSGGSLGDIASIFQKLAVSTAEANDGSEELQQAFKALGLDAEKFKDMDLESEFLNIAAAIKKGGLDDPNKLRAFLQIFGKGAGVLVPFFKEGFGISRELKAETDVSVKVLDDFSDDAGSIFDKIKRKARSSLAGLITIFGFSHDEVTSSPSIVPPTNAVTKKTATNIAKELEDAKDRQNKIDQARQRLDEKQYELALRKLTVEQQIASLKEKAKNMADSASKELVGGDQLKALEMLNDVADLNSRIANLSKSKDQSPETKLYTPGRNELQAIGGLNRDNSQVLIIQRQSLDALKAIKENTGRQAKGSVNF